MILIGSFLTIFPLIAEPVTCDFGFVEENKDADSFLIRILFYALAIVALALMFIAPFSYPIGTGILLSLAVLWFFSEQFSCESNMRKCTFSAVLLPVAGNLYMFVQPLPFLRCPTGTAIRPMGWTAIMFVVSVAVTILSLVWTIRRIIQNKKVFLGVLGVAIGLLPVFTVFGSFHLIAQVKGLILKP